MQKTPPLGHRKEEVKQIYLCWEHYLQFVKSPESQVSWKWWNLLFYLHSKFGSFKNPFATITSLSELYFRFRKFILLVQTRKMISMNYGSCTSSWKPVRWVRLDLILTRRDIHQFQPEPTCKIHYQQQKYWVWRYPPMENLSNDHKCHPNQHKNSHMLCHEMGHPAMSLKFWGFFNCYLAAPRSTLGYY